MIITNHAYKRIKSRCGLKKKAVNKLMLDLKEDGVPRESVKGRLRKYVDWLWHEGGNTSRVVLHRSYVFIFEGEVLITVWKVPQWLKKSAISQCRKGEKNET